jgi:hypothetical protein
LGKVGTAAFAVAHNFFISIKAGIVKMKTEKLSID